MKKISTYNSSLYSNSAFEIFNIYNTVDNKNYQILFCACLQIFKRFFFKNDVKFSIVVIFPFSDLQFQLCLEYFKENIFTTFIIYENSIIVNFTNHHKPSKLKFKCLNTILSFSSPILSLQNYIILNFSSLSSKKLTKFGYLNHKFTDFQILKLFA